MERYRVQIYHGIYETRVNQRARSKEETADQALLSLGMLYSAWDEIVVSDSNLISFDEPRHTNPSRHEICA